MLVWNSVCLQQPQPRKSEAALADTRLKVKHGHCATIPLSLSLGSSLKTASHARACGALAGSRSRPTPPLQRPCAVVRACGPARGRQIWRFRPRGQCCFSRPSEVVGLYHCTALGLLVYWLTACLFRCRKAKKKVRTLS